MQSTALSGKLRYRFSDMKSDHIARVAVVPVFAGTTVNGFLSDHTSGTYPAHDLMPVPLVPAQELITGLWRPLIPAYLWRRNNRLSFELALLGGHMRLVEKFVGRMLDAAEGGRPVINSWDSLVAAAHGCVWDRPEVVRAAVQAVGAHFADMYRAWLFSKHRPQLVAAAVLAVPLLAGGTITLDGDTVDSIVQHSPVAVSRCAEFAIRLSFSAVTLLQLCLHSSGPLEKAVSALYQSLMDCPLRVGFEAFELVCAQRLAVQIMAAEYFDDELRLKDVFPGASFSEGCGNFRFSGDKRSCVGSPVENVLVVQAREQFPGTDIVDIRTGVPVTWDRPVVVINAASAPFADLAARLASGVTLLCQIKRYFKSGFEVDGDERESVVSEVRKIDEKLKECGRWFGEDEAVAALYISLGYGAGGKRMSEEDRAEAVEDDVTSAHLPLPTAVVYRGGGFDEVFGVLADSVALKADEYVRGSVQDVPAHYHITRAAAFCTPLFCARGSHQLVVSPGATSMARAPCFFPLRMVRRCCNSSACAHCHVVAGALPRIVLHVNGYVDRGEVEVVAGTRCSTRALFLDALLAEDTPYFTTHLDFRAWLEKKGIPYTTFTKAVVSLW